MLEDGTQVTGGPVVHRYEGNVFSGLGRAQTRVTDNLSLYENKVGVRFHPGTLNVRLTEDFQVPATGVHIAASLRQTYRPNARALANKARISRSSCRLVACIGTAVVGVVDYWVDGKQLRLFGLGVIEGQRRQGVARALVDRVAEIARDSNITKLVLHTVRETGNVPIFERLGFKVVSARRDDLSESETFDRLTDAKMCRTVR